jgi:membrane-associated protease RseP (regulator of RpoE activity)
VLAALLTLAQGARAQEEKGRTVYWVDLGGPVGPAEEKGAVVSLIDLGGPVGPAEEDSNLTFRPRTITETSAFHGRRELPLGVEVAPPDAALRSQLALPEGKGLVITKVCPKGPAEEAGLEQHDVLLSVADVEVGTSLDLPYELLATVGKTVPVVVLRRGKKVTVEVTPKPNASFFVEPWVFSGGYRIGIEVAEADDTLRSQLGIPEGQGLVVVKVEPDGPAEKAGIGLHDVLLEFGGTPLSTDDDLRRKVQEVGNKAAAMQLLREGKSMSLQVTPSEPRWVLRAVKRRKFPVVAKSPDGDVVDVTWSGDLQVSPDGQVTFDVPGAAVSWDDPAAAEKAEPKPEHAAEDLGALIDQIKRLTEKVESLERAVQAARAKPSPKP